MAEQQVIAVRLALEPKAKARIKCQCKRRGGPICPACGQPARGSFPHAYQPGKVGERWIDFAAAAIAELWGDQGPMVGPLRISGRFVKRRPQSRPTLNRKTQAEWVAAGHFIVTREKWATGERVYAPTKPDIDRLENNLFDAITLAGVWLDDCQIADNRMTKWYAARDEEPHVRFRVEQV